MATQQKKIFHNVPVDSLTILKPHNLGRNYHKIPSLIQEAASKNPRLFSDFFLKNYRINIDPDTVKVHDRYGQQANCIFQTELGKIGFSIDRRLLVEALESYYGGSGTPRAEIPPPTVSEQRLRNRLGKRIVDLFIRAMLAGNGIEDIREYENDYQQVSWEYVAEFGFLCHDGNARATMGIHLDADAVDALLGSLDRPAPSALGNAAVEASLKQLPVRLDCVIVDTEMPLSQVLELEPGDILVLRPLERYEVRINQQTLFRGAIFEENGALYLTSLESVTSS